jgi:predicted RecA/RadA family phage recombinase
MANNFKYSGRRVTLAPTAPVASGVLARVAGFIGIPLNNRLAGESVSFALEGAWGMTFAAYGGMVSGGIPTAGSILYWDTNADALSIGAANDDFPAVKCVTAPSATDGSFEGLLLPQTRPYGQTQA